MPIDWSKVFDTAIDITVAVGQAAMQLAVMDAAIDKCRGLKAQDVTVGFSREVAQMPAEVWDAWQSRLAYLANVQSDATAAGMLTVGALTRSELTRVGQLMEYAESRDLDQVVTLALQRMQDQELPEQICFYMALAATGERDLRADLIVKRLVRRLRSG